MQMFPVDKIDTVDERKAFDDIPEDKKEKEKPVKEKVEEKEEIEEEEESEEKEEKEEKEPEEDLEEEKEEESEEEEDEEELESDTLYQQLKKVNKDIFKEVPELRSVIFREQKYTEIFSTVEEATQAKEAAETFASFQTDIEKGNPETLLSALGDVNKDAQKDFVANFIPTVEKLSKDLYLGMLYPEFKKMLRAAAKSNDERLQVSAQNLNWFIFGDTNVDSDAGLEPKHKDDREDAMAKREREFEQKQLNIFSKDINVSCESRVKKIITFAFKDSDLSELMQRSLANEIFARVDAAIAKDPRHMGNINNLWKQARKDGFTSDWKDRIINAYLSRAKLLIPNFRQKVLAEAKISGIKQRTERKEVKRIPSGAPSSSYRGGKVDPKKVDWNQTDERAALDGNIVLKGK
jgi:hypothetical protein